MSNEDFSQKERRHFVRKTDPELHSTVTIEKRKYIRLGFKENFDFTVCSRDIKAGSADSLDICQNGIHFTSTIAPKKNTLISMKLNSESLNACLKFEVLLHEDNGEILGKVVRVEPSSTPGHFDIVAVFLKKGL